MEPPPTHRSKAGFRDASLYSNKFPNQNFARVPGYTGHIPGKRDDAVGETMGRASHQSMSNSETTLHLTASPQKRDGYYTRATTDQVLRQSEAPHTYGHTAESDRRRTNYRGGSGLSNPREAIYRTNMTPGYSGFVPQTRDINGARGAVSTTLGIAMHDRIQEHNNLERERSRAERRNNETLQRVSTYDGPSDQFNLNSEPLHGRGTYNPTMGVMNGCTKFMPQRPWLTVAKTNGDWTKQSSEVANDLLEVVGNATSQKQIDNSGDHSKWKFRNGAYGEMPTRTHPHTHPINGGAP